MAVPKGVKVAGKIAGSVLLIFLAFKGIADNQQQKFVQAKKLAAELESTYNYTPERPGSVRIGVEKTDSGIVLNVRGLAAEVLEPQSIRSSNKPDSLPPAVQDFIHVPTGEQPVSPESIRLVKLLETRVFPKFKKHFSSFEVGPLQTEFRRVQRDSSIGNYSTFERAKRQIYLNNKRSSMLTPYQPRSNIPRRR